MYGLAKTTLISLKGTQKRITLQGNTIIWDAHRITFPARKRPYKIKGADVKRAGTGATSLQTCTIIVLLRLDLKGFWFHGDKRISKHFPLTMGC